MRYEYGLWRRQYALNGAELSITATGPAPQPLSVFASAIPSPNSELYISDTFGLPPVLDTAAQIRTLGAAATAAALALHYAPRQDLSRTITGLSDEPFSLRLPLDSVQAGAALADSSLWSTLKESGPPTLEVRIRRIALLLFRLQLERQASG
jgi:hypothetical protein